MEEQHILLYDFERDKDLKPGQAILVFNTGLADGNSRLRL